MATAIYPGTFDPVTSGHLDILNRACHIFDKVIVGVAHNLQKKPLFSSQERVEMIANNMKDVEKVEVVSFDGLVVDFAREQGATVLIRGLRAVSDFEFEFQMTQMNRDLDNEIETIFLMPSARYRLYRTARSAGGGANSATVFEARYERRACRKRSPTMTDAYITDCVPTRISPSTTRIANSVAESDLTVAHTSP